MRDVTPDATKQQLAAFAWFHLQSLRQELNLGIVMPKGEDFMGQRRGVGILGDLFEARGAVETARLILSVTDNFATIRQRLHWMSTPPGPDAGLFRNRKVIELADNPSLSSNEAEDDAAYFSRALSEV